MGRKSRDLNDRVQVLFRMFEGDYLKLKAKTSSDKITIQKLFEVLCKEYLKNNKDIVKLAKKHANEKQTRRKRYSLSQMETDQILKKIEELSPMKDLESAFEEVKAL